MLLIFDLKVGQGGGAARTPVDDPLVAVDETLIEEVNESSANRFDGTGVQVNLSRDQSHEAPSRLCCSSMVFP